MKNGVDLVDRTILLVNTCSIKKRFILQRLKKIGVKIVCLNKEKNWAQPYIDHWILADNANHVEAIEAIEKFLKSNLDIKIEGVLTFWEDDVLLTARLADKFHFVGIPFKIAQKARNKYIFREICQANNIPAPKHRLIKTADDLDYVRDNFKFPLVIKPVYGSSSAFVVKIETKDDLLETYNYVKNNISAAIESSLSDGSDILLEEYIDGDEVDIDILLQNGKIKFYSITDNYKTDEPFFIETGMAIPSGLPEKDQLQLAEMAEETLEKLGVQNGCIHFEAKSTKNGPVPLEANLRMGGDEVYSFVKGAWGVDLIENAVKIALGIYIKIKKPEVPKKYLTGQDFLSEYSGVLAELDLAEEIKNKKYLEELNFFKKIGDPLLVPPEGFEYLGWITVSGDNPIDAEDNLKDVMDLISYKVVKFDTDSSLGKTSRKNSFSAAVLNKDLLLKAAKMESIRRISRENRKNLSIGIACNIYEDGLARLESKFTQIAREIERTLRERGYKVTLFDFNNLSKALADLKRSDIDIIFNVCERINNSSLLKPNAAAMFEVLQIPYTGSNFLTLSLCNDKIRFKKLLSYHNIPTPEWDYIDTLDDEIRDDLGYPLIVKPGNTNNSIGITNESVVNNKEQLQTQLKRIISLGSPAIVEEYIEGDEYNVSIIGSEKENLRVLPLCRLIFNDFPPDYWRIFTYEAKWSDSPLYKNIILQQPPKNLNKKLESLITEIALDTYNILDCSDYSLVQIRVDEDNNPYVIELNSNPLLGLNDYVPTAAKLIGMDYGDLLEEIIDMAVRRYQGKSGDYRLYNL